MREGLTILRRRRFQLLFAGRTRPLLLGVGAPLWTVVTGAFVGGMCIDIFGVLWETTMQREVPPAALSRVSSYDVFGSFVFGPLGLIAAGPLATSVGPRPALVAAATVIVLPTLAALFSPGYARCAARPAPRRPPNPRSARSPRA